MHVIAKKSTKSVCCSFYFDFYMSSCQKQRHCLGGVLVILEAYFVVAYLFKRVFNLGVLITLTCRDYPTGYFISGLTRSLFALEKS